MESIPKPKSGYLVTHFSLKDEVKQEQEQATNDDSDVEFHSFFFGQTPSKSSIIQDIVIDSDPFFVDVHFFDKIYPVVLRY